MSKCTIDDIIYALECNSYFEYYTNDNGYMFYCKPYTYNYHKMYIWESMNATEFCIIKVNDTADLEEIEEIKKYFIKKGYIFIFYNLKRRKFFTMIYNTTINRCISLDSDTVIKIIEENLQKRDDTSEEMIYNKMKKDFEDEFNIYEEYVLKSIIKKSKDKSIDELRAYVHEKVLYSLFFLRALDKYKCET